MGIGITPFDQDSNSLLYFLTDATSPVPPGRTATRFGLPRSNEMLRRNSFFVQTPCRSFPIESHTQLPFVGWLPRPALIRVLRVSNKFWIKRTSPDWHLLGTREMAQLFPGAEIVCERFAGLTKSIMAIKSMPRG